MTKLDESIAADEDLLGAARQLLSDLRTEIRDYTDRLAAACEGESTGPSPDVKRLGLLIGNCVDTENRLAKARAQQAGIAQGNVAFDIDAARAEIGRKLARLRDAAGEG